MFNVGPEEMAVLALLAVIIFGPDKLPQLAKQAAQMLRTLRDMSTTARKQLGELSPGLTEELSGLNLGGLTKNGLTGFNAKTALQKMIFDDEPETPAADIPGKPAGAAPIVAQPKPVEAAPAAVDVAPVELVKPEPAVADPAVPVASASSPAWDEDVT